MNAIIQRGTWEGCRPFSADERLALWASRYYASGHHRERSKPRIRVKAETQKPIETNETERGRDMRTDDEILARIKEREPMDPFGFATSDYVCCLSFDAAKPFLIDDATASDWTQLPRDRESVVTRMFEYMPFAWEKANNCRGLSAVRSMEHYMAWTWLAGDDFGDLTDYQFYGKDNLVRICNHYGWDSSQWDDGIRTNTDD